MTKATGLKTIFFKKALEKWVQKHVSHFDICLKQKNIFFNFSEPFFGIFFNPPQHPNYESYRSNFFFNELALTNWAMHMLFNPVYLFSKGFLQGGGRQTPPRLYIDSDPPVFIGLKSYVLRNTSSFAQIAQKKLGQTLCV